MIALPYTDFLLREHFSTMQTSIFLKISWMLPQSHRRTDSEPYLKRLISCHSRQYHVLFHLFWPVICLIGFDGVYSKDMAIVERLIVPHFLNTCWWRQGIQQIYNILIQQWLQTITTPQWDRNPTENRPNKSWYYPQMAKNRSVESRLGGVTEVLACVGQSCRCYYWNISLAQSSNLFVNKIINNRFVQIACFITRLLRGKMDVKSSLN